MKTLYLGITLIFLGVVPFLTLHVYGLPHISPQVEYFNSDTVVIGKVLSADPFSSTHMKYQIQVEQYMKNPQNQDVLTVIAEGTNKTLAQQGRAPDTIYDVGQQALLYLKKKNDVYTAWYFSHSTDSLCNPAPTKEEMTFTLSPDPIFTTLPAYSQLRVGEGGFQNLFQVNQTIPLSYDTWNRHYTTKSFDVVFEIKNETTGESISNMTKQVELKPCIGHQTVSASFVPRTTGTYEIDVIFDNRLEGTTVEVRHNFSSNKLAISTFPLPFQQFHLGTKVEDVKCSGGLALVIKSEDGSPACVKYTTADVLLDRKWAKGSILDTTASKTTVMIPVNSSNAEYGFNFAPSVVKTIIGINNTVRWINMDDVTNDITSNTGSFSSGLIESGHAWTHTFDKIDNYGYHSAIHPWLKGAVIVSVNPMVDLKNDSGTITLRNQTYYFETPNYTHDAYFHPVQISFHDVVFTLFPSGFRGGLPTNCGETYYWADAKFSDDTSELLHIFAGLKCPVPPLPTMFSNHTNPQAGMTFYDGKMKLLVNTENEH